MNNMVYYKITTLEGELIYVGKADTMDEFLDIKGTEEQEEGVKCDKIEKEDYDSLMSIQVVYTTTGAEEDDYVFKPTNDQKIKLLLLEYFKNFTTMPDIDIAKKYFDWFKEGDNR